MSDSIELCKHINGTTDFGNELKLFAKADYIVYTKKELIAAERKYKTELPFISISKPLFYRNRTRAVFSISKDCGGLCGFDATYIYYKKHGRWKKHATLVFYIK